MANASYSAVNMPSETGNIGDLAKESTRKETRASWFVGFPLTVLAPVLVALALVGVVLPNTIILSNASQDSVSYLAGKYLTVLLEDVRVKTETPIKALVPIVYTMVDSPYVIPSLTGNKTGLQNSYAIPTMSLVKDKWNLDTLLCVTTEFKTGFSAADFKPGGAYFGQPVTNVHAMESWIQTIVDPATNRTALSIVDNDLPNTQRAYALDSTTRSIVSQNYTTYGKASVIAGTGLMQLGLVAAPREPFFTINRENLNLKVGLVIQQKFLGNASIPSFACAAGISVDATWNNLLRAAKPAANSVVAIFDSTLKHVASSNMIVSGSNFDSSGQLQYASATADEQTLELEAKLLQRYGSFPKALAEASANPSFEIRLGGERWIVNIAVAKMSVYNPYLLVAAIPRTEVFGVIDAASSRSRAISIGISVAMALAVAAIFVLAVLPLATLATQMEQLTKLNFGTLESSGALDRRSWVWELRKVQIVFATMVKAFAGAIKKNKSMVGGVDRSHSSNGGAPGASARNLPTLPRDTSFANVPASYASRGI
ncbi:hypothetical protein DFJ77DRAFT_476186 [Powellomyces hirtus]|nr:hypothetical protein DFJ77DRAFT_476186 [Powellomyces hirtus]